MPDKIPMTALGQNQNLINPVRIQKVGPVGMPAGFYQSMLLDVTGLLAAFFAGYSYFKFLEKAWPIPVVIGSFLLFTAVFALQTLLGKKAWRQIGITVLQAVVFLLPFYFFDSLILAAAGGSVLLFFLIGYADGRSEVVHGMTIRFFRATNGPVANAVTGLLLAVIILYLPVANAGSLFVGESTFNGFFTWSAGMLGGFYPTISFMGSFHAFAESVAKDQLAGNTAFKMMPPASQSAALAAATGQIEANFSRSIGVIPSPTSSTSEVAYQAIVNLLQNWRSRFSSWFMIGWGVAVFFLLRGVGIIAVWIGQFLAMIIYETLLSAGIIHIRDQPSSREILDF